MLSDSWRIGQDLPQEMRDGASVQFGRTFLMIGGADNNALDLIYEFDPRNDGWILRDEKIDPERRRHGVTMVGDDVVLCE